MKLHDMEETVQVTGSRDVEARAKSAMRPFLLEKVEDLNHDYKRRNAEDTRGRRVRSSSGSSFLEVGIAQRVEERVEKERRPATRAPKSVSTSGRSQDVESVRAGSGPAESIRIDRRRNQNFEKRKRHKTRDDRYEPTARKRKQLGEERTEKPTRKRPTTRRNAVRSSGAQLMEKFASKSVGKERLTVRPLCDVGIFKHGRASLDNKHRGLPDLAFSEMEFLRCPKGRVATAGKASSRHETQEELRRHRTQNEVSTYFQTAVASSAPARPSSSRPRDIEDDLSSQPVNEPRVRHGHGAKGVSLAHKKTSNIPRHETHGPRVRASLQECSGNVPRRHNTSDAEERVSTRTTYVTWSASVHSENVAPADDICSRDSITPISVRRSLDATKIFIHTGIERDLGQAQNEKENRARIQQTDDPEEEREEPQKSHHVDDSARSRKRPPGLTGVKLTTSVKRADRELPSQGPVDPPPQPTPGAKINRFAVAQAAYVKTPAKIRQSKAVATRISPKNSANKENQHLPKVVETVQVGGTRRRLNEVHWRAASEENPHDERTSAVELEARNESEYQATCEDAGESSPNIVPTHVATQSPGAVADDYNGHPGVYEDYTEDPDSQQFMEDESARSDITMIPEPPVPDTVGGLPVRGPAIDHLAGLFDQVRPTPPTAPVAPLYQSQLEVLPSKGFFQNGSGSVRHEDSMHDTRWITSTRSGITVREYRPGFSHVPLEEYYDPEAEGDMLEDFDIEYGPADDYQDENLFSELDHRQVDCAGHIYEMNDPPFRTSSATTTDRFDMPPKRSLSTAMDLNRHANQRTLLSISEPSMDMEGRQVYASENYDGNARGPATSVRPQGFWRPFRQY